MGGTLPTVEDYIAPVLERHAVPAPILRQVPVAYLGAVWPQVASWIEGVVNRTAGKWSVEVIAKEFLDSKWQMWVVHESDGITAVLATELYTEATGMKLARIVFCTGRGAKVWAHLIEDIEEWARDNGAVRFEMMARKGWERHMKAYRATHVLLEKDL